jgi:hypothetical protein
MFAGRCLLRIELSIVDSVVFYGFKCADRENSASVNSLVKNPLVKLNQSSRMLIH